MTITPPKPVEVPRWATNPGTRLTPTLGQQDTGWLNGQRPPFNVMNWLQGLAYDWQQYLEDATDELESTKLNRNGSGANGIINGVILPDVNGRAFGSAAFGYDVSARDLRVTRDVLTTLLPDVAGTKDLGSLARYWGSFFSSFARVENWLRPFVHLTAEVGSQSTAFLAMWASAFRPLDNPAATVGQLNRLAAKNTPKAWGIFQTDGVGGITLLNGFNISGVALSGGAAQITFASAMANANYVIMPHNHTQAVAPFDKCSAPGGGRTATNFLIGASRENAGGNDNALSMAVNVQQISFTVFGEQ